jgi:hypothetical protein
MPGRLQAHLDREPLHIEAWRAIPPRIAGWDYRANALQESKTLRPPHLLYPVLRKGKAGPEAAYRATRGDDPLGDCPSESSKNPPIGTPRFYADIEAMIGRRNPWRRRGRPRKSHTDGPRDSHRSTSCRSRSIQSDPACLRVWPVIPPFRKFQQRLTIHAW